MFKVGDIVSYSSGDGVFEGEITDIIEDVLTIKSGNEPLFYLPMQEATLVAG